MIERQSITGYPARSGTCPMARPMVCPLRDRRGCADGRWADRLASTVTLMPGQIWVAKGVRGKNRSALGSLACVAMFWSSAASVGRSRLPCQWCVAPLHGSAQPNEPRPKCPGDPASRFYSTPIPWRSRSRRCSPGSSAHRWTPRQAPLRRTLLRLRAGR